jgi:hypothetical protein
MSLEERKKFYASEKMEPLKKIIKKSVFFRYPENFKDIFNAWTAVYNKIMNDCVLVDKTMKNISDNKMDNKLADVSKKYEDITNNAKTLFKKLPLEEILIEDSNYDSSKLKKRLIEAGLKEDRCEECGIGNEWNGKPLTLQVHHINGNHRDNRIGNLQILCPNCHSQTENYGSKNIKKHNHCADCGKEIALSSTWCPKCAAKHNRACKVDECLRPSKQELLELIQTKPFTEIGRMYGVSDNAIRKWCKNMGLPTTKKELNS